MLKLVVFASLLPLRLRYIRLVMLFLHCAVTVVLLHIQNELDRTSLRSASHCRLIPGLALAAAAAALSDGLFAEPFGFAPEELDLHPSAAISSNPAAPHASVPPYARNFHCRKQSRFHFMSAGQVAPIHLLVSVAWRCTGPLPGRPVITASIVPSSCSESRTWILASPSVLIP
jgi:hypothetical protein